MTQKRYELHADLKAACNHITIRGLPVVEGNITVQGEGIKMESVECTAGSQPGKGRMRIRAGDESEIADCHASHLFDAKVGDKSKVLRCTAGYDSLAGSTPAGKIRVALSGFFRKGWARIKAFLSLLGSAASVLQLFR